MYGAMFGPGGPCMAEGDDLRHRRWSGRTNRRGTIYGMTGIEVQLSQWYSKYSTRIRQNIG